MKKIIRVFCVIVFLIVNLSIITCADGSILETVNQRIKEIYGLEYDYFPESIVVDGRTCKVYLEGRQKEIDDYGYLLYPLTYAPSGFGKNEMLNINPRCFCSEGGSMGWGLWNTKKYPYHFHNGSFCPDYQTRYVGYDKFGNTVIPYFNNDHSRNLGFLKWTHGVDDNTTSLAHPNLLTKYNDSKLRKWIQTSSLSAEKKETYNNYLFSKSNLRERDPSGQTEKLLEAAIQIGIDEIYDGVTQDVLENYAGRDRKNLVIHHADDTPIYKWSDALLITVPPTDISWGYALRFNESGGGYLTVGIPVAPFNMAVSLDLSVNFRDATVTANPGDTVSFTAEVRSNLDQKTENIAYKWTITDANGNPISGVSYGGHGTSSNGVFNTEENKAITKQFIAQFTMPETAVNVTFEVNGDKKHAETNTENNKVSEIVQVLMPTPPVIAGEVILDFDIYSRDHNDNLAAMTARFSHDCDSITAYINAESQNTSILSYYSYQTRDSDSGRSITVTPWYKSILYRTGFGDNPEGRTYLPNGIYPLMVAQVGSGKAIGNYVEPGPPGEDGSPTWISGSQTSYFPTTTTNLPVTAYVYNGVPLGQPYTKNEVSSTNILWTSEIIDFNVVRKMYHMDANGNRVNEKDIPGQYVRHFSAQNSASVVWSAPLTQAQAYANDRRTAANRGATYQNAIFATDKEFAKVDYPVKSGYMFNPLGTYKCVVNSTVYYDSSASEAEKKQAHEELVNKVINSFVYDNAMTYTNNGKDEVSFMGVTNSNKKGILNISRTDNVSINLIPVEQYNTCMEGYEESGTLNSFTDYKYREYIVTDRVSRIDAQTVLTFTVGSPSKRYTHINLPDGQYPITARSLPFAYKGLTAPGVYLSDGITVSVRGSLYDDRG